MTGMLDLFERSNGNLYLPEDNTDHVDQFFMVSISYSLPVVRIAKCSFDTE